MDISREIYAAQIEHEVEFGRKPTKLYLGRRQCEALRVMAWEMASYVMTRDVTAITRSEYRGMKIYGVDDENYIGVGV